MFAAAALLALPLAANAAVHNIVVGGPGKLAYDPPSITAAVGDIMHFVFHQKNHTITQSTFADPCTPMAGGFTSGFQPVPDTMTDGFPTCDWEVKTADPIWGFCQQAGHCSQGMVFAVNAPATGKTFDAYQTAAKATAQTPAGGDPYGGGGAYPPTASGSAAPAASSPAASGSGSAPAPAASGSVIQVTVGGGGGATLLFNPSRVDAKMGDIVSFVFKSKNHTVTQSSFADPCTKLAAPITGTTAVFDSGFQPSTDAGPTFPTYNVTVTTTSPMWFFCEQGAGAHCKAGMVFAINSVESGANNYNAFVAKAKGTSGASSNSSTSGSPAPNGAVGRFALSAGTSLGVVGAVLALLL